MAGFARRQLDVLGFARSGNEAAVQLFAIRDGKTVDRDVFLLENLGDGPDDEALGAFVKQYYASAGSIPPRVLVPFQPAEARGPRGPARQPPRDPRGARRAAARGGAGAVAARRAQRSRDAGPGAGALAGGPGQDPGGARASSPRRWGCRPADAHRVLRHQHDPGHLDGGQHGGVRGGPAAERRVPPVPDPDRGGAGRLRQPPGGAATPVPTRAGRARRGAPRSCAGACPTWSSSTAARARSARREVPRRAGPARPAAGGARQGARGAVPARVAPTRSSCPPRPPRCTWSSGCATRRTDSPSPTTASCAPRHRRAPCSMTCPAWARPASARCCACSGPRRRSARRATRSPRSRHPPGPRGADPRAPGRVARRADLARRVHSRSRHCSAGSGGHRVGATAVSRASQPRRGPRR